MEPITTRTIVIAVIFIVLNTAGFWVREWLKHRTWNKNGKDLKEIKVTMGECEGKLIAIDEKVQDTQITIAKVKTAVGAQTKHCKETVNRFDETIRDQNQSIIDLAGRKR